MMTSLSEGFFLSKLFTFVVGPDKKPITVHAESIARQSLALNVLINGQMSEAQCRRTEFDDVPEETFIRFCQFSYTGDYVTPTFTCTAVPKSPSASSPPASSRSLPLVDSHNVIETEELNGELVVVNDEPVADHVVVEEAAENWFEWGAVSSKKCKKKLPKNRTFRKEFDNLEFGFRTTICEATFEPCKVRSNGVSEEDFTPVFLAHAQLYVFAEKWGIEALKMLTLRKIHRTLSMFTLWEARRGDIAELTKFVYFEDNIPDLKNKTDALRALVIHYVTCELESLIEAPEFLALLEQPGPLARDLVKMMMKRVE